MGLRRYWVMGMTGSKEGGSIGRGEGEYKEKAVDGVVSVGKGYWWEGDYRGKKTGKWVRSMMERGEWWEGGVVDGERS